MTIPPGRYDPEFHTSCYRCGDTGHNDMFWFFRPGISVCEKCLTNKERNSTAEERDNGINKEAKDYAKRELSSLRRRTPPQPSVQDLPWNWVDCYA